MHLSHRAVYAEAPATGLAPQEIEPGGKASEELQKLFEFVDAAARANTRELRTLAGVR